MHNDETQRDEPIPLAANPYDFYPFSGELPDIPPPPPKKEANWNAISAMVSSLSLIVLLVLLGIVIVNSFVKQSSNVALTPTATISTVPYTAVSIYSDFIKAGLQMTMNHSNLTDWQMFGYIPEDGSVQWTDDSEGFMSLAVFSKHSEAITDQNQIYRNADGPVGVTVINRCLLDYSNGGPASTIAEYINFMSQYCT